MNCGICGTMLMSSLGSHLCSGRSMQRRRVSRLPRAQSRLKLTFSLSLRVSYTRYVSLLESLVNPILTFAAALCLYHDPERPSHHEEHRQILVHRKLPLALVPGKRLRDVSLPGVDYPTRNLSRTSPKHITSNTSSSRTSGHRGCGHRKRSSGSFGHTRFSSSTSSSRWT